MRRVLAVLCAVFCLGLSPGLPGSAALAAPQADPIAAMMSQLAGALEPYSTLASHSVDLLNLTLEGTNRATAAGSTEWVADWQARMTQARAAVQAERDRLPPFKPGALAAYRSDPRVARLLAGMAKLPDIARGVADSALATADEARPLVPAAAAGDRQARADLLKTALRGLLANLDAQDAMLDFGGIFSDVSHPQSALSLGIKAQNDAQRQLLSFRLAQLSGQDPDPAAALAATRQALARSRAYLAQVRPLAAALQARVSAAPVSAVYKARLKVAVDTYGPSADVELRVDDLIEQNTEIFLGDNVAPGSGAAFDAKLAVLSQQRLDLQDKRQSAFAP